MPLDKVKEVWVGNYTGLELTVGVRILDDDQLRVHIGNWKPKKGEKTLHELGYPHRIGARCDDWITFIPSEIEDIESDGGG